MSLLTLLWWSHIIPWIVRPQYCYRYWINFLWWMIPTRKIIFHFEHLNKIYGKAFLECSYIYNLNTLKYSPITVTVSLCVWKDYVTVVIITQDYGRGPWNYLQQCQGSEYFWQAVDKYFFCLFCIFFFLFSEYEVACKFLIWDRY